MRYILRPFIEIYNLLTKIIIFWPSTSFGSRLRKNYYRQSLKGIGKNITMESGVRFGQPNTIIVGDNCIFGRNVNVNAGNCNGIFIGDYVAMAEGTYIRSGNHSFDNTDIPIQLQGHTAKVIEYNDKIYSIVIEDDVWIGAHVIILSGAKIGKGSIISAGSVISNEIPPYSIVVGNPGRIISNRLKKQ